MYKRATLLIALLAGAALASDINLYQVPKPVIDSGLPLAPANAAAVTIPSAPDAWGGPRTGTEATLSDRVANYTISATLDPDKHSITGQEQLTWRNRSKDPVRSVYLHLYLNAFEGPGSTFFSEWQSRDGFRSKHGLPKDGFGSITLRSLSQNGAKASWSFVHPDGGPALDHTVVRVDLPAPVAGGASTMLDIGFTSQLPRVVARTGYIGSFHLVGQWFPKIAVLELAGERGATSARWNAHEFHLNSEFYADFGLYDVKLTVPKDYVVGATGELQGAPLEKGGMLTHHYVQGDVHDFAWTADKRSAAPLSADWKGVNIRVLYPPEFTASAAPAMQAAKDSLDYFGSTLGPYPYKTLTVVIPPLNAEEAGGMEYPTFITAEGYRSADAGSFNRSMLDFVTIHEFGHNYFYGILASNEFEEPLLDEGLNEYWNSRMQTARQQPWHTTTPMLRRLGFAPALQPFDVERMMAPREEPADAPGQNAWQRLQGIGPVYNRSATVLRDLEAQLGKDATARAYQTYYQRWKFRHPSTADLREVLAEVSGQRALVEAHFANQIYQTRKVDDRLHSLTSVAEGKQWRTTVTVRRRGAAVPQTIEVRFEDGSKETAQWSSADAGQSMSNGQRFTFLSKSRAVSAELDPKRQHYLDVNKFDDSKTLSVNKAATRRWTLDAAATFATLAALLANL